LSYEHRRYLVADHETLRAVSLKKEIMTMANATTDSVGQELLLEVWQEHCYPNS
jgi:hypothetical protein